jgi:hypothetical protein
MSSVQIGDRPLSPPEIPYGERDRIYAEAYTSAFAEVLRGDGPFWPANDWRTATDCPALDNEQEIPIFAAVRRALSGIGLTDAERWAIVHREVCRQAGEYARIAAGEAQ